ncbi:MAG: alpha-amylase [Bacillota bacterium]
MDNGVMLQGFEWYLPDDGSYYRMMTERAEELAKVGFAGVWIPPVFKSTGTNDVGYGIYDMYDLGEFDQKGSVRTKYGLKTELRYMIKAFHENGVNIYADVVMNHKAGGDRQEKFIAIEVDTKDRNKELGEARDISGWTGFDFTGRGGKYSEFKWNFNHFNGVDYDDLTGKKGIFRIIGENKGWNLGVSIERGNYDYLMFSDIDHAHPEVKAEFIRWAKWFIEETGVDGFRLDAVKHIDAAFLREFIHSINTTIGEDFYIFGEYWVNNLDLIEKFLNETSFDIDLFDVPLHFNLHRASLEGDRFDLRSVFDNTLVRKHPTEAVTFVDNHDSQPSQGLQSWVEPWFKEIAYALILLRSKGYPCVFYGDYYGTGGEHQYEGIKDRIDRLIHIRRNYCFGEEDDYFQEPNVIGWVRKGTDEKPERSAVVISNKVGGMIRMHMGAEYVGREFIDKLGNEKKSVVIQGDGFGEFSTPAAGVSAWVLREIE